MIHKVMFAVNPEDDSAVLKFLDRLLIAGIHTKQINCSDKYKCFESIWDDSDNLNFTMEKNSRNAGAKPKELKYNGKPVSCGSVYLLKKQKHLSDAELGELLDVSESTISRRIKKHLSDGNFFENSRTIF